MKAFVLCCLVMYGSVAFAKDKPKYQNGVLVNFRMMETGTGCSSSSSTAGNVNATTTDDGYGMANTSGTVDAKTTTSGGCTINRSPVYQVSLDGHTYMLEPYISFGKAVGGSFLFVRMFYKNSVLYGVLPGTPIKVSSAGNGAFYVKVGKRESRYKLVGAQ